MVLDGVEDPRNLGAILRTAEAAGADGVLLPERHSAGLSETVARASAGALEHVKVARVGNLVQALEALKARGVWVVGFDAAGTERWDAVDYTRPVALVLGGEGRGIRRLVREHCDHLVSLPLFGHVGSLNVSVAAGIALYEVVRQRRRRCRATSGRSRRARRRAAQIVGPGAPTTASTTRARAPPSHDGDAAPRTTTPKSTSDVASTDVDLERRRGVGPGPAVLKPAGVRPAAPRRRPAPRAGADRRPPGRGRPWRRHGPRAAVAGAAATERRTASAARTPTPPSGGDATGSRRRSAAAGRRDRPWPRGQSAAGGDARRTRARSRPGPPRTGRCPRAADGRRGAVGGAGGR